MLQYRSNVLNSKAGRVRIDVLTMVLGYWREGRAEQEAAFHLYFRTAPFHGGYTIACGLEPALAYLEGLRFTHEERTSAAARPRRTCSPASVSGSR